MRAAGRRRAPKARASPRTPARPRARMARAVRSWAANSSRPSSPPGPVPAGRPRAAIPRPGRPRSGRPQAGRLRLGGLRLGGCGRFGRRGVVRRGRRVTRHAVVDDGELRAHRDRLVLVDRDAAQDPGRGGGDLGVHLVRRHLQQRLVRLHALAFLLQPARDGALGDALTELRHGYGDRHDSRDSYACTCRGLPASARCASPIASDWVGWGWMSWATSEGSASQL